MTHNAEQTGMVWGALNSMEQKMDLTWNAEHGEMETDCRGNCNETENGIWT